MDFNVVETCCSTSFLCSFVIAGPSGKLAIFLPTRILVDMIYFPSGSGFGAFKSSGFKLLLCLSSTLNE